MTARVKTGGIRNIKVRIDLTSKRIKNPAPVWVKVGSYLAAVNRKQFATHGAYLGKPWKPLKPEYLQWKIKNGYSRKTLMQTGAMRLSFVSRPVAIEKYYKKSAVFGSDNRLAPYHQYGTFRNGKRAIPPRPIMYKNRQTVRAVKSILADHIAGKRIAIKNYM